MKEGIHPNYVDATVRCACGEVINTKSTKGDFRVEICSKCHPFFTGKQKFVDAGGRVDDWAFKKGVRYGSIIVSLNTRAVIDLLGDRDIESFKGWLDDHTQVKIVSRDRSTDYTAAIAATGRNITEVADRFHLNKNMSDCVTKVISSHYADYRNAVRPNNEEDVQVNIDFRQVMLKLWEVLYLLGELKSV